MLASKLKFSDLRRINIKNGFLIGNLLTTIKYMLNNMIMFFCKKEYTIYEYSPISMLYHYFAGEHPRNFSNYFSDMPPLKLLEGWSEQKSTTTGRTYYANEKTRQTQFEIPNEFFYYGELSEYFKYKEDVVKLFRILNEGYQIFFEPKRDDKKTVIKSPKRSGEKTVIKPRNKSKRDGEKTVIKPRNKSKRHPFKDAVSVPV